MGKQSKKMGKIYRQFSRIRYDKYKKQFPRVRQSELINRIIKEWEVLDEHQTNSLFEEYKARGLIKQDQVSSESDSLNDKDSDSDLQAKPKQPKVSHRKQQDRKVRILTEADTKRKLGERYYGDDDYAKNVDDDHKPGNKPDNMDQGESSSQSILIRPVVLKKKKKKKSKAASVFESRLAFEKYYWHRLPGQHPSWSIQKCQNIIRLLWLKRMKKRRKPREKTNVVHSGPLSAQAPKQLKKANQKRRKIAKNAGRNPTYRCLACNKNVSLSHKARHERTHEERK